MLRKEANSNKSTNLNRWISERKNNDFSSFNPLAKTGLKDMTFNYDFGYFFAFFSSLLKKSGKKKRRMNNQSRDQKSCLSDQSLAKKKGRERYQQRGYYKNKAKRKKGNSCNKAFFNQGYLLFHTNPLKVFH